MRPGCSGHGWVWACKYAFGGAFMCDSESKGGLFTVDAREAFGQKAGSLGGVGSADQIRG